MAAKHLARAGQGESCSASEISDRYGVSAPLMAKVLQKLARGGVVVARHGSSGGYQLARDPNRISALDVISAVEGPVLITSCVTSRGDCEATLHCSVREPLRRVNDTIVQVLGKVTISQMSAEPDETSLVELQA